MPLWPGLRQHHLLDRQLLSFLHWREPKRPVKWSTSTWMGWWKSPSKWRIWRAKLIASPKTRNSLSIPRVLIQLVSWFYWFYLQGLKFNHWTSSWVQITIDECLHGLYPSHRPSRNLPLRMMKRLENLMTELDAVHEKMTSIHAEGAVEGYTPEPLICNWCTWVYRSPIIVFLLYKNINLDFLGPAGPGMKRPCVSCSRLPSAGHWHAQVPIDNLYMSIFPIR